MDEEYVSDKEKFFIELLQSKDNFFVKKKLKTLLSKIDSIISYICQTDNTNYKKKKIFDEKLSKLQTYVIKKYNKALENPKDEVKLKKLACMDYFHIASSYSGSEYNKAFKEKCGISPLDPANDLKTVNKLLKGVCTVTPQNHTKPARINSNASFTELECNELKYKALEDWIGGKRKTRRHRSRKSRSSKTRSRK